MKAKHILVMILVSSVTALTSVFLYSNYTKSNQLISQNQAQLPVNYAGFDGGGAPGGGPADFEAAANTSTPAVVHIKTKTNPTQTSNQQKKKNPYGDVFGDDFFDDFFGGPKKCCKKGGNGWWVGMKYSKEVWRRTPRS